MYTVEWNWAQIKYIHVQFGNWAQIKWSDWSWATVISSNKFDPKAPKWVRLRLVKVESTASEARELLKGSGNTSTRTGAGWACRGHWDLLRWHRIRVLFVFSRGNRIKRCSRLDALPSWFLLNLRRALVDTLGLQALGSKSGALAQIRSHIFLLFFCFEWCD